MAKHIKSVTSKEMDINEVKYLSPQMLKSIKTDRKIINGFRKDLHNIILLSTDYNVKRKVPTIDLRTFSEDKDTGEMVPTKRGFRLDPSALHCLIDMLNKESELVHGTTGPNKGKTTDHSRHLEEQMGII